MPAKMQICGSIDYWSSLKLGLLSFWLSNGGQWVSISTTCKASFRRLLSLTRPGVINLGCLYNDSRLALHIGANLLAR